MLIGIDGNEANIKERVGVNVWAFELLHSLAKITNRNEQHENRLPRAVEAGSRNDISVQIYLSKPPLPDMPEESEHWQYRVIPPAKFWTRWRLPLDLCTHSPRPGVFFSLSHYAPKWVPPIGSTRRAPMPRVACIMDLSFLKYPEAFRPEVLWQLKNWTRESVRNAAHIITISEFNKKEIERIYKYPAHQITVVYPGISETFKGRALKLQGSALSKYGIAGRYLLFVGTLQPKKNLPRLIEAFSLIQNKFPNVQLVIAGKIWPQFASENEKFRKLLEAYETSIKIIGYVPDEDLLSLMAGAEGLVLPSLYEGFGIPVVEAMSVGTPIAVSNTTSLLEIVGDHAASFASRRAGAGFLFDPLDVNDIAKTLEKLFRLSPAERKELSKKGMIRAKMFDWDVAANKVMTVLQSFK